MWITRLETINNLLSKNKKIVILLSNKKKILDQLETFSINKATLFPEIDSVANYIKNKYQ